MSGRATAEVLVFLCEHACGSAELTGPQHDQNSTSGARKHHIDWAVGMRFVRYLRCLRPQAVLNHALVHA